MNTQQIKNGISYPIKEVTSKKKDDVLFPLTATFRTK